MVISRVNNGSIQNDDMVTKVICVAQIYLLLHAFVMDANHLSEMTKEISKQESNVWVVLDTVFAWAKFELHLSTLERIHFFAKQQ